MPDPLDLTGSDEWDEGIRRFVTVLRQYGVETFESCQGGPGHSCPEPVVRFHGPPSEGMRAYAVTLQHAFPVFKLQRTWRVDDGELTGPWWEIVFILTAETNILGASVTEAGAEHGG